MTRPLELDTAGLWSKFSRYEIRDGFIGPAPGSRLQQYDPWALRKSGPTPIEAPYEALATLLSKLRADLGRGTWGFAIVRRSANGKPVAVVPRMGVALLPILSVTHSSSENGTFPMPKDLEYELELEYARRLRDNCCPLPPNAAELIAEWCSRFGLLGILPHICESVRLAPTDAPFVNESVVHSIEFQRSAGAWTMGETIWESRGAPGFSGKNPEFLNRESMFLARQESWLPGQQPIAVLRHIETQPMRSEQFLPVAERLQTTWGRFFPSIGREHQDIYQYPLPLSKDFWEIYAEPVEEFLRHAVILQATLESMQKGFVQRQDFDDELILECLKQHDFSHESRMPPAAVQRYLDRLLFPVGLSVSYKKAGKLSERFVCPSLLSCMAKMAVSDFKAGFRMFSCGSCGRPVVSDKYQTKYCSEVCLWRAAKQRARKAAKHRATKQRAKG